MKVSKKEKEKIKKWVGDYFCDIILPVCKVSGYKLRTTVEFDEDKDRAFSIGVNFPYRHIQLYVREGGIRWFREKEFDMIRLSLFHEAFHVIHWKYREYAESRYIDPGTLKEFEEDVADRFSMIVDSLYQLAIKNKTK